MILTFFKYNFSRENRKNWLQFLSVSNSTLQIKHKLTRKNDKPARIRPLHLHSPRLDRPRKVGLENTVIKSKCGRSLGKKLPKNQLEKFLVKPKCDTRIEEKFLENKLERIVIKSKCDTLTNEKSVKNPLERILCKSEFGTLFE